MKYAKIIASMLIAASLAACGGGGGSSSPAQPPVVTNPPPVPATPLIVKATSYENAKEVNAAPLVLPRGIFRLQTEALTSGFALGDFFQDGTLSMVAFTNNFLPESDPKMGTVPGSVYFLKQDARGNWVNSSQGKIADQTGCISPRKVIVADFNGDGKPDVFAACHGIDRALRAGETYGETPRLLLSQPDGTYKNIAMNFNCYCHGAAAAELNAKGYADIVYVDPKNAKRPVMLINNHDNTFTPNTALLPRETDSVMGGTYGQEIWSVELIDFNKDGKIDLWLGGSEDGSNIQYITSIYHNPGNNDFSNVAARRLPAVSAAGDNNALDLVFKDDVIYLGRVNNDYKSYSVQRIDYKTSASSVAYTNNIPYANGSLWVDWLTVYNNQVVAMNKEYPVALN